MLTGEAYSFIPCTTTAPPNPAEYWQSVSTDFVFGFPKDAHKNNGILVFFDQFSKMVNLDGVGGSITAQGCARVYIDTVFRLHGLPVN